MEDTYPLAADTFDDEELDAAISVIKSRQYTMAQNVSRFERAFAEKFEMNHAVMVNSGSSANVLGIAAYLYKKDKPLVRDDEVIVPAIAWATTFHPLQQCGLKVKFVDVDLETLNIDIKQLEQAITPKTRLIVGVSILGNPAPLDRIRELCDEKGIYLFEDNCESMGAKIGTKYCGTFGDISTFSFFFSHHISTMEGGMLLTNNREMYELICSMRAHGWTRDLPENSLLFEPKSDGFFEAYRFILPGYNFRPIEIQGAVGLVQLRKFDTMLKARRENAEMFHELFSNDERFILQKENGKSSYFSFTMILSPGFKKFRNKFLSQMRESGIRFRMITGGCFLKHDVIKYFNYECHGEMKQANYVHENGFFVGNHPRSLEKELTLLKKALV